MSSSYALNIPSEIWLKIASHLVPYWLYHVRGNILEPFHPSPGAGIVGPLLPSSPPKDVVRLSCACRTLRSILGDDINKVLSLHMRRRRHDNTLVHLHSSLRAEDEDMEKGAGVDICEIANLPLGNHIRHLRLVLRDTKNHSFSDLTTLSQEYCDDAAPILYGVPCIQSLRVYAKYGSYNNYSDLSPIFCQALSSLKYLHTLDISGHVIPAYCPTLPGVECIQTNRAIQSFESLPQLKYLRAAADMDARGYHIPKDTLVRLKLLHYHPPVNIHDAALLPQVCRVCTHFITILDTPSGL